MWAVLVLLAPATSHALPTPKMTADAVETTIALLGGLGLRAFVLDSRYVPSESMVPTLLVGDLLILEKVSFRAHPPTAGEVVCFRAPPALAGDDGGLPGGRHERTEVLHRPELHEVSGSGPAPGAFLSR